MMKRVLLWELPVADVFAVRKIVGYYRGLGVRVPWGHVKVGMVERWVGYLPAGLVLGAAVGLAVAVQAVIFGFSLAVAVELPLMMRGKWVWKFFREKDPDVVAKIFLLEGFNAVGYFFLGVALGILLF